LRYEFDWDPNKERKNIRNHRISFRHASMVFRDPNHLSLYDEGHSDDEDRWITIGIDSTGIIRIVIHTFDQIEEDLCQIRIISARKATSAEQNQYHARNR
jgi:hypothetical protein